MYLKVMQDLSIKTVLHILVQGCIKIVYSGANFCMCTVLRDGPLSEN